MGFQNSDSEDELLSHFISLVATTDNENGEVINAVSIAVEESHHWKRFLSL